MSTTDLSLTQTQRSLTHQSLLEAVWQRLTLPNPAIADLTARRQAQALSALMLMLIPFGILASFAPLLVVGKIENVIPQVIVPLAGLAIWCLAYGLSRTRYHRVGATLAIGTLFIGIFALMSSDPSHIELYIVSLVAVVLLMSILFSLRATLLVLLLCILCSLALPFILPQVQPLRIIFPVTVMTFSCLLVVASVLFRRTLENDRKVQLAASEARYRNMFESNQAIKWLIDPVTRRIVDVNQAACDFYGYSRDEMVGKNLGEINMLSPDELAAELADASQKQHVYLNMRHRLASGEIRDVEIYTGPNEDHGRKLLFTIIHDVTERKRAEVAHRNTEEQLRSLITSMADTVYSIDLEGRLLVYHHPVEPTKVTLIAPPKKIVGQRYDEFFPPDLATQLQHTMALVYATYNTQTLDYCQIIDGEERYFSARVTPLMTGKLQLNGVTVVARDVTLAVQTSDRQARLFEFELLDRAIADIFLYADDPEIAIDSALGMVGTFIDLSAARVMQFRDNERLLDTTYEWDADGVKSQVDNLKGIPFLELVPSLLPTLTRDGIINASRPSEMPADLEALENRLGVKAILEMPFYVDGRLQGVVNFLEMRKPRTWMPEEISTLRTITECYARMVEAKKARFALIQARDDALRSARLKSEFVSNMSHEVRTPMTGVLGMLELLQETPLDDEQREFAEAAFTSAHNLLHILDDILDFSKIEAGKIILEAKSIDIRGLISEIRTMLSTQAAKKMIALSADIADDVPLRISGDPTRLRQILMNLVTNALKFTHTGGVTIVLRQIGVLSGRSRLRFEIVDTGIGIAAEQVGQIFDSFVQADGSITRKYGGSGLGLAICQQLIQLMGGYIEVNSTVGKGSTFAFNLTVPIMSAEGSNLQLSALPSLCALVIDADSTSRYVLAQQLRMWDITVLEATDNLMAQQILRDSVQIVNIVFYRTPLPTDVPTADDPVTFVRQLRAEMGVDTPTLAEVGDGERLLIDGRSIFDAYLPRPVRQSQLFDVLIHLPEVDEIMLKPTFATYPQLPRILVAEDHALNREIIKLGLEQAGMKVDFTVDGLQALEALLKAPYDLVLMDIRMPIMDGLTATRYIRAMTGPLRNIPIIAVTAGVLPEEQQRCLDAGINVVLGKPFSIERLRHAIHRLLQPILSMPNP